MCTQRHVYNAHSSTSQQPKSRNNPNVPLIKWLKYGITIQRNTMSLAIKKSTDTCDNMGKSQKHYAYLKKSDTKDYSV